MAVINIEQLRQAQWLCEKYRSGKANYDNKLIENEDWWKMRHDRYFKSGKYIKNTETGEVALLQDHPRIKKQSAWMFNSIMNKHADIMDNFPDPVIMARSKDDDETAKMLSSVVPVILDNCNFEQVYSDNGWDKLCFGSAIYGVVWNKDLLNGLGDIEIVPVDILNFYWEPGVKNIQDSQNIFVLSLMDNKILEQTYPQTVGQLTGSVINDKKYNYDDSVDTTDKSIVVDWYYKRMVGNRTVLHYVKYVDDIVLYSSEDDPACAETGFYAHGKYPFVMDTLFRVKGTPAGFGYIDIMKPVQERIDELGADILENAAHGTRPRYFVRDEGTINEKEFRNLDQQLVHCTASLDDTHIRVIEHKPLDGNYLNTYQAWIDELKETSGNRDFSQGSTASGVTSGAAISALQEAGNKNSRDLLKGTYRAFSDMCELVIELIRQFYNLPRTFRITGETGQPEYVEFDNAEMQSGNQSIAGEEFKTKQPVFDIIVKAQKANPYSRLSQNELAFQFYDRGFFNPELSDQALATVDMMDFEGKDKVKEKIQQNGVMFQQIQQMQQTMMQMAQLLAQTTGDTRILEAMAAQTGQEMPQITTGEAPSAQDAMGEPMTGNSMAAQARRRASRGTEVQS